jgi:hypothetical protein
MTRTFGAGIVRMSVCPAASDVVFECRTRFSFVFRTTDDLPARDERLHVPDSRDAQLLFGQGMTYALKTFDIGV